LRLKEGVSRHVYMSYAYSLLGASFSAAPAGHGYAQPSHRAYISGNQVWQLSIFSYCLQIFGSICL
jgi:hypothetical protein